MYPHGAPGMINLLTPDPHGVKEYYTALFGWAYAEGSAQLGPSTVCLSSGSTVAVMNPLPDDVRDRGLPPVWTMSVVIDDVDAVLASVRAHGGSVRTEPRSVPQRGITAAVTDPSGGSFGLWQPQGFGGAELTRQPGAFTWVELHSRDRARALPFYAEVFGWRWIDLGGGSEVALLDSVKGLNKAIGSAREMPAEAPAEAPSYWLVFFGSDDPAATAALSEQHGGSVFLPAEHAPGLGTYAGLTDPAGASFMVVKFDPPSLGTIMKVLGSRLRRH